MNYKFTKNILSECSKVIIFGNTGAIFQYKNYLKNYVGLDSKESERILKLDSRYILISRECPMYIMTEKIIFMII